MSGCKAAALLLLAAALLCTWQGAYADDTVVDLSDTPKVVDSPTPAATGTDTNTKERENVSLPSAFVARKKAESGEQFKFQAEVNRLMDILIHSLYSNKDIFLRELISNASDALDKIRFLSLTDKSVLGEGENAALEMKIWLDKESKTLYLRDRGIGMTKDDLVKNLGTIAKSGTSAFLEQMQKGGDVNLIGQFGVGFYSVYLVADWVEVVSKHNDDSQWVWSSGADGSFSILEDSPENEPLGRGTLIKIHLKPEALEYADEAKLRSLVGKYSEFINFPIRLLTTKEVEVPVEEESSEESKEEAGKEDKEEDKEVDKEEEEDKEDEKSDEEEDVEDEVEEESTEEKKPKTRKEEREEWEVLNDNKAIWLRTAADITDEEYQSFYKAISKDMTDALGWVHFKAEGDVEFKSILYVPKKAPWDFYEKYYERVAALKLYVRRVFISDDVAELLPRYLSFLRGIVDSDTLPLNVSREMLQAHSGLKTIRKKLVRKLLDWLKRLADDAQKCKDLKEGEEGRPDEEACGKYGTFWSEFGKSIKMGIIDDTTNRIRLAKLLRFHTSKHESDLTSLDEYVGRMKEGQKQIYFVTGLSLDAVKASPFLEKLLKKGYEVIYWTDVLDEYVMQHLQEYDSFKFADISKEDVKLSEKDEKESTDLKDEFKPLTKWWKAKLGEKVAGVKLSTRLSTTPCIIVTPKYGQSANMERIMQAQAMSDVTRAKMMRAQRTLEINPRHPLILSLKEKVAGNEEDMAAQASAQLLYETALLESGFALDDVKDFSQRMYALMAGTLGVEGDLHPPEEPAEEEKGSSSDKDAASSEDDADEEEDAKDEL